MTTEEIINKVYKSWMNNESIDCDIPTGLRVMYSDKMTVGTKLSNSTRWDDGTDTREELNGVCTIQLQRMDQLLDINDVKTALNKIKAYHGCGDTIFMVLGSEFEYGEDSGELVISEPVICDIICSVDELLNHNFDIK